MERFPADNERNTMSSPSHESQCQVDTRKNNVCSPKCVRLQNIQSEYRKREDLVYWINRPQADAVFAIFLLLYALAVGVDISIDLKDPSGQEYEYMFIRRVTFGCQVLLSVIFVIEMTLRYRAALAKGEWHCCTGWGLFDTVLVLLAWSDNILQFAHVTAFKRLQVASAVRAFRVFRVVRVLRLLGLCPMFQLLCAGMMGTISAIMWCAVLLFFFASIGALLCASILGNSDNANIRALFHGVPISMLTHVKLALAEAWPDIASPMLDDSWIWAVYVAAFLCLTNIALLNVVTGVICEQIMDVANKMPPKCAEQYENEMARYKSRLKRLFQIIDADDSGTLCMDEYIMLLRTPAMRSLLMEMGIALPLEQNRMLLVLDEDDSGSLTSEELWMGLLKFRGTRGNHDSHMLQFDLLECNRQVRVLVNNTEELVKFGLEKSMTIARESMTKGFGRAIGEVEQLRQSPAAFAQSDALKACAELSAVSRDLKSAAELTSLRVETAVQGASSALQAIMASSWHCMAAQQSGTKLQHDNCILASEPLKLLDGSTVTSVSAMHEDFLVGSELPPFVQHASSQSVLPRSLSMDQIHCVVDLYKNSDQKDELPQAKQNKCLDVLLSLPSIPSRTREYVVEDRCLHHAPVEHTRSGYPFLMVLARTDREQLVEPSTLVMAA